MKIKTMLDCYATIVILRAGGSYQVPTIDTATGADERALEWIEQARIRMDGWHEADKKGQLFHDEAVDLSVADVLLKVLENGAPKAYRGRPVNNKALVAAIGTRGASTSLLAALDAILLMETYCQETDGSLINLQQSVMKCYPRKGTYSGLTGREKSYAYRCDARHRRIVKAFIDWHEGQNAYTSESEQNPSVELAS